jgi:hypothetical protein
MRQLTSALVVGMALAQTGCVLDQIRPFRDRGGPVSTTDVPTAEQLVRYLNENSKRVDSLRSNNISISCYYKLLPPMQLDAKMVCEKPRNLRLAALSAVGTEVDLGSNSEEFWWWIKRGPPAQFYCSYKDLEEGRVREVPFPFQPEWIMEAMGVGNYGTPDLYLGVRADNNDTVKLYRRTRSAQGRDVLKVIVFNRRQTNVNQGVAQVLQHQLIDERSKTLLVSAEISQVQVDRGGGGVLPRVMTLSWPAERLKMTMKFDNLVVNAPIQGREAAFAKTRINNIPAIDLARIPAQTSGLQRVQGRGP